MIKKVYPRSVLLLSLFFAVSCSYGQSLSSIPGLALWLRADMGVTTIAGDSVTAWADQSGQGNNVTSSTGQHPILLPDVPLLNNLPSVYFNGVNQFLTGTAIAALNNNGGLCSEDIFIVCKADGAQSVTNGHGGVFTVGALMTGQWVERLSSYAPLDYLFVNNEGSSGSAYVGFGGMPNSAFPYRLFEVRKKNGVSVSLDTNSFQPSAGGGTQPSILESNSGGSLMCGLFTNGSFNLGFGTDPSFATGDGYFNGEIAEVIVFANTTCLTGAQIQQVETYLYNKYAPAANFAPDTIVVTTSLCGQRIGLGNNYLSYSWSPGGATTDSITVTHTGNYTVNVMDVFHRTSSATITVIFPDNLPGTARMCEHGSVELVPYLSSLTGATYSWSSGQTTETISATTAGNYFLTVTDAGCTSVLGPETVVADTFDRTVSLGSGNSLCTGNQITLVSPSSGWGSLTFHWSDGSNTSFGNVSSSGTYSVTVTDAAGCSGSASVTVTITGVAPYVDFSHGAVCTGSAFTPTNLSTGTNLTYHWGFGDGSSDTSDLQSPTHNYLAGGTYQVTLTAYSTGCTKDTVIPVVVDTPPVAAFQTGEVCTSFTTYTFMDLSTPAPGQTDIAWSWSFGDPLNGSSTMQNPTYTYTAVADTYAVTLTVTQTNGCSNSVTNLFIVETPPAAPTAPVLQFPVNGSIAASDTITFGWASSTGAAYYRLVVSTYPLLNNAGDSIYLNIYSNQKTVVLPNDQTYYWQVTAYNACGDPTPSVTDQFTQFVPSDMAGNLALWLKADAGVTLTGGAVTQWSDSSGNNYNATAINNQSHPAMEPSVNASVPLLDYKPTVHFNGTTNYMTGAVINNLDANSLSIFIVARADGAQVNTSEPAGILTIGDVNCGMFVERDGINGIQYVNDLHCNGDANYGNPPHDANSMPNGVACPYHIYSVIKNIGVSVVMDTNGVFTAPPTPPHVEDYSAFSNPDNDPYYLGWMDGGDPYDNNAAYSYLNGEIAEVIIYNTALSNAQQTTINNYLFNKYAPPVNLGPDIVQNYKLCPVTLHTGNRFVSYLWSTGATSDTLVVTQSGTYSVTTIDVFNRTSSDSIHVTLPYAGSNPTTDYVCFGDTGEIIQLINTPNLYSFVWYDSISPTSIITIDTDANFIRPYTPGNYYTKITDSTHCSFITKKVPLIIDNFYSVQLLTAFDTICKNGTVLINTVPYTIDTFLWTPLAFPNDTLSTPVISDSGEYYLYTVDNHGCKNHDSVHVATHAQAPVVNFTVPNLCLANTTLFIDSSFAANNGDWITSYSWSYGGGIPSSLYQQVSQGSDTTGNGQTSYAIDYGYGNYTVSLTVTTDSGCFGVKTRHITILPIPNAGYLDSANNSVYPYILCAGATSSLQLTDTSTALGGSSIVQQYWEFNGVRSADTDKTIQYSFPSQGIYNITLVVVNSLGCADSVTQTIDVHPPFVARMSVSGFCLGDYTTFTDITQSLSVVSRSWNFRENGEGPFAYGKTVQFLYDAANTYDVELQLENAIGCLSTIDTLVKIVEQPVAAFGGLVGCQNHYYTPLDSSYAGFNDFIARWNWDIAGRLVNGAKPRVLLPDTGAFDVSLKVTTQAGCVDSITQIIEVASVPTALFSYTPLYGTAPLLVTFTNSSTGATYFDWNFGDGDSTTTQVPQINPAPHNYIQNGNYNVMMYAYNNYGCYDSLVRPVYVMPTDLCLQLEQVETSTALQPDGSELVTLSVILTNVGTRIITSAQLYATLGSTEVLEQNWAGNLLSGQSVRNTFPAQFVVPAGYTNTYVCVNATDVNGGETEVNCPNLEQCASLTGTMQLAGPSPNPAGSTCQLGIILPQAGTVYIAVYDMLGNTVVPEFSTNLPAERTNYNIPVAGLEAAEYFIRVRYNDDTEVRSFVVR